MSKKVDAMEALLEDASPNGKADLGYWNSSALRKRVGDDPFFDEPTALRVLAILREVADDLNTSAAAISQDAAGTPEALRLVGFVIGDFIDIESAIYLRYPHLEPAD